MISRKPVDVVCFLMRSEKQVLAYLCVAKVFQEKWKAPAVMVDCPALRVLACSEASPFDSYLKQFWLPAFLSQGISRKCCYQGFSFFCLCFPNLSEGF